MPGLTTSGLPYPLPTEPVKDGAQAIRNLADTISARTTVSNTTKQAFAYTRYSVTTNASGYVAVGRPANMTTMRGAFVKAETGNVTWRCHVTSLPNGTGGLDLVLTRTDTGAVIPTSAFLLNIMMWGDGI
jgi:hypothetical protein